MGIGRTWAGRQRATLLTLIIGGAALATSLAGCSSGDSDNDTQPGVPPPLSRPCDEDSECSEGRCDPLRGCVGCLFDWDCASGQGCTNGGCVTRVSCDANADCANAAGKICDLNAHECVACAVDSDCGKNERCDENVCRAYVPCVNSLDCPEGLVCDRTLEECVGCVGDSDCGGKQTCVENTCTDRCESDKDCQEDGLLCGPNNHCVQCIEQVDCPDVYHCTAEGKCELDVCEPERPVCDASERSILTCNEIGDTSVPQSCGFGSSCVNDPGGAKCEPWLCDAGLWSCEKNGVTRALCAANGLSIVQTADCEEGQLCYGGQCVDIVCAPNSRYCDGASLYQCDPTGTFGTFVATCGTGYYCDESAENCSPVVCNPGEKTCIDNAAGTCSEDGSGLEDGGEDCGEDVCVGGECFPKLCEPGKFECQDDDSYVCNATGTGYTLNLACSVTTWCDPKTGFCTADACVANTKVCEGDVVKTCAADGSGFKATTDCADDGKKCWNGACLPQVCSVSYFCDSNDVWRCYNNGTAKQLYDECGLSLYCKEGDPECNVKVCDPGSPTCNGNTATTCNDVGSGPEPGGTDCSLTGEACALGTCLPKICEPNSYFCENDDVMRCGTTGATSSLQQNCSAGQFCTPGDSTCNTDVCTAGATICNGNLLTTCASNGSGPVPGGTDCTATSQVCDGNACKDVICEPNERFCQTGDVRLCNAKGTASSLFDDCLASEFCDVSASPVACWPDLCVASGAACDGETLATCNTDGSGYSATTTDCSLTDQVCHPASGCVASAVDTVGATTSWTSSSASRFYGNFYSAFTTRKLTQIEQYFSVSGTSIFTWAVYSSSTYSGTFTRIFQATTSSSGAGAFHSSGPIEVTLEAGKYYFIGVHTSGSHNYYYSSVSPAPVSFGQLLYGTFSSATSPPSTWPSSALFGGNAYHQRLTTTQAD